MGFMDSVSTFTKGLGEKAKGNYDVIALNNKISSIEREMNGIYLNLGRKYYSIHKEDAEEELSSFVDGLKRSEESITELKQMVEDTKAATAAVQLTAPKTERVCPGCGSPVGDELFCAVCGTRQEPVVYEDDSETSGARVFCPNCGSEIDDDSVFCVTCGTKLK